MVPGSPPVTGGAALRLVGEFNSGDVAATGRFFTASSTPTSDQGAGRCRARSPNVHDPEETGEVWALLVENDRRLLACAGREICKKSVPGSLHRFGRQPKMSSKSIRRRP